MKINKKFSHEFLIFNNKLILNRGHFPTAIIFIFACCLEDNVGE